MSKALRRGLKQAIVAQTMIKHGVKSFLKPPKDEIRQKIKERAQAELDRQNAGGDASQIVNYLLNPSNAKGRDINEIASRLKAKVAAKAAVKKVAKKATAKKTPKKAPEASSDVQVAA
jgi:hypothetical protein